MSRLSLRAACSIGLALMFGMGLSACGDDECTVDSDCESGLVCGDSNQCETAPIIIITDDLCEDDSECTAAGEICSAGKCEEGCRKNADCNVGVEFCDTDTNTCAAVPDECARTSDCPDNFLCEASGEAGDGPLKCVPECSTSDDCDAGLTCDGGVCTGCLSNSDCDSGEICRIGRCAPQTVQCGEVGLECDPDLPIADGYVCAQFFGDEGTFCYESCRSEDVCALSAEPDGAGGFTDVAGLAYFESISCPQGSICDTDDEGREACRRSECENPVIGQETCDAIAEANPSRFPNGANCNPRVVEDIVSVSRGAVFGTILSEDNGFFCQAAGTLQRGDAGCLQQAGGLGQVAPRCAPGLTCMTDIGLFDLRQDGVEGVCEQPCTNDAQCDTDNGESCIGLDSTREFNSVGVCGHRCEPFVSEDDACPTGKKCFAVTSEDGYCTDLLGAPGTSEVYGECQSDQSCPNGTVCLNFGLGARCTPQCDPTASNQEAANETCMGNGYCYDLEQGTTGATRPGTGVCFQRCDGYADFGGDACTESGDDCSIFTEDTAVCFPVGAGSLGDTCADDDGCGKGLFCDEASDGSGVCRSYCTMEGFEENTNLAGCQGEEVCFRSEDIAGLGECHLPCTPNAPGEFFDSSCPTNMQTCYPHEDYNYYCSASGSIPENEECAQGLTSPTDDFACAAGTLCARDIAVPESTFEVTIDSFVSKQGDETSSCKRLCRPFLGAGQTDCGEGYACTPVLPVQEPNTFAGICTKKTEKGIGNNPEACSEVGRMCDDSSFCSLNDTVPNNDGLTCAPIAECFELCNPATSLGCSEGKSCDQLGSTDIPSYFIGEFGICRDRD